MRNREKFIIYHPDEPIPETRPAQETESLPLSPCDSCQSTCKTEDDCTNPCAQYFAWYDARMAAYRRLWHADDPS